ncbi:2-amino-4-hydroxy-6-hydroxymethyldihydropteridine diphosphokinase [Rhizobium leguminosarum]
MHEIAFSFGGNVGDTASILRNSMLQLVDQLPLTAPESSSFYITVPWGVLDQRSFVNAVLIGKTARSPFDVLNFCLEVERCNGRHREAKWGPRTLDIDIIYYGDLSVETGALILPHPFALERSFVLVPLLELRPHASLRGQSCKKSLEALAGVVGEDPPVAALPPLQFER